MSINFAGKGTPIAATDFQNAVAALGGDEATLWALVAVETHGFGYLADRRPQILFERHIFHKRTNGIYSQAHPDISNPASGGYSGGAAEYDRLDEAMQLDERAALESASWGLGQVMGFNAAIAGYTDVYAMVAALVASEGAHLQALVNFIVGNPALDAAFRARTWDQIASIYNGPAYQDGHYDEKLEQHYAVFQTAANRPNLDLRTGQACLKYLGYLTSSVDGVLGPSTQAAILAFRSAQGLAPGDLDDNTLALAKAAANI